MRNPSWKFALAILWLFVSASLTLAAESGSPAGPQDILVVSGTISNLHGEGIRSASLKFFADGKEIPLKKDMVTSSTGTYEAELSFPQGSLTGTKITMEATKPSYKTSGQILLGPVLKEMTDGNGNTFYLAHKSLTLTRFISPAFRVAAMVLIGVYALIAFEFVHRTLAAFLGASLILLVS